MRFQLRNTLHYANLALVIYRDAKSAFLKPLRPAILRANNGEHFDLRYYEVVSLRIRVIGGVPLLRLQPGSTAPRGESITGYNVWEIIKTYNAFWTDTRVSRARGHCSINSHAPRVFHYRTLSQHTRAYARLSFVFYILSTKQFYAYNTSIKTYIPGITRTFFREQTQWY